MSDHEFDIEDIEETDPVKVVIELEKRLRPNLEGITTGPDIDIVHRYYDAVNSACKIFAVEFSVLPPRDKSVATAREILYAVKTDIDKKRIELLHKKLHLNESVELDDPWRQKIHTYISHIRTIVEKADINLDIRDGILRKLHTLDAEVDRTRSRVQIFNDTLVELCKGVSGGATALRPAVSLFERVIGSLARLRSEPRTLALPAPTSLGLEAPEAQEPIDAGEAQSTSSGEQ